MVISTLITVLMHIWLMLHLVQPQNGGTSEIKSKA